ncbi:MAG TPA: excinuclease ABC subunit UvrC [Bacteroidota bacterium]|jgi:excinuclease ABC subunit C|nr:excinuclease ABC subunit UvrC [Bacteroidota bacterium]
MNPETQLILEQKLKNLPTGPGVYQFKSENGEVLYVGKAINLRNRVRQYFQKSYRPDPRREVMVSKIVDVELIVTDSEVEALILETNLIQKIKPRYNIDLKDDKSFPYIVVTNEPYPRVFATRRVIKDGSRYFGPYTEVRNMHDSLKIVREIYKVRSCNYFIDQAAIEKKKIKICFDYHIKKCDGPCEGLISKEAYNAMIGEVIQILKGKTSTLVKALQGKMNQASEEMRYEDAGELRDKIRALSVYADRQKIVDTELIDRDLFALDSDRDDACGVVFKVRDGKIIGRHHVYMAGVEGKEEKEILEQFLERYYLNSQEIPREIFLPIEIESSGTIAKWLMERSGGHVAIIVPKIGEKAKLLAMCRNNATLLLDMLKLQRQKNKEIIAPSIQALQKDLRLEKPPRRIECFDISNIQGTDSVASMVVFIDGKTRRSEYRKFKIRTVEGTDDFASMREVIERRYTRVLAEQAVLPDLVVIDGGKGQLSSAVESLTKLNVELPIIGLAKRLEEVFVPQASDPQSIPKSSPGLKLLQRIRDEAHRFAVTYHRALRSKRVLQTELDLINGVGKKRATLLLESFGSVQGVKFATMEQLVEVIGEKTAAKIKEYFSDEDMQGKAQESQK